VIGVVAQVPMTPGAGRMVRPRLSGPVGLSYARFEAFLTEGRATAEQAVAAAQAPPEDTAGWLGVEFQALDRALVKHLGISDGGAILVTRVIPGSPAGAAGIAALDILVALDGERIAVKQERDLNTFIGRVRANEPGAVVTFTRERRGGASEDVAVTLAQSPKTELHAERNEDEAFDLTVRETTLDTLLSQRLDPTITGVVVDGVTRAGWAGLAGLSRGMIIQRINDHDVSDLDSFRSALAKVTEEKPSKVLFFVRFRRDTRFFVAEPDWDELDAE
jgi:S1-C subfamily serine protease